MNYKRIINLSLLVFFLYIFKYILMILMSYVQFFFNEYSYAFLNVQVNLFNTVGFLFITWAYGREYWKNRPKGFLELSKNMSFLCLPLVVSFSLFTLHAYLSTNDTPWEAKVIFKLHEAQYKQDAMKYYRENVSKVTMEKDVSDSKDMPIGFPASLVRYNIVMNQDSTYTIKFQYIVSPFWGKGGYLYYSGTSNPILDDNTSGMLFWGNEFRCLEDKWYFWYFAL